ncbi:conjugative transfer system coupling protein TraD [Azospirillum sp. B21]|uniref:conjugative transfer system coupling protein TraD n=1 Tax=Azospirillum sp. B21 TaxID=2607496 RepID=UPI0011EEE4BB|nr:conjugative transfer system coupling protein TraD [Azospirillum sp. B21]KAA0574614.1 conjugative transfer system coupling protein TraD [Azospirillum sp. B21]
MSVFDTYEMPYRPNYELASAAGCAMTLVAAPIVQHMTQLPPMPFYIVGGMAAGLAVFDGLRGTRLALRNRRMRTRLTREMDLSEVQQMAKRSKNSTWVGYGFRWEAIHTQRAVDLSRLPRQSVFEKGEGEGATWMHGLESKDEPLWLSPKSRGTHVNVFGTTGAGKTKLFSAMVAQDIMAHKAVMFIDPKGDRELQEVMRRVCVEMGVPEKFVYFHPAFPDQSARIDPLYSFNRATELASRIAVLLPGGTDGAAFVAFSQKVLNNILQGITSIGRRPTLMSVRSYLELGVDELVTLAVANWARICMPQGWKTETDKYLQDAKDLTQKAQRMRAFYIDKLRGPHPNQDLEGLLSMWAHNREHMAKMIATLLPLMDMLTSGTIGRMLSPAGDDPADTRRITNMSQIIRRGEVVYIGLDTLSDPQVGYAIGSILMADLTSVAGDRYNFGIGNRPVAVYVDEAASTLSQSAIEMLNKGRGAGFEVTLATQLFADYVDRFGSEDSARRILGNTNSLISLRTQDINTAEFISEGWGKVRVRGIERMQGEMGAQDLASAGRSSVGEKLGEESAPLVPPSLLMQLPDLEYFMSTRGGKIYKGRLPILKGKA